MHHTIRYYAEGHENGASPAHRRVLDKSKGACDKLPNSRGVVFVVDDEVLIAKTLAMILNQTGFAASAFENPYRALESAAAGLSPDLLITDVIMPGMSGIELAVQFRKEYPGCKVLLFSGQAATADMLATAKLHGHDFEILAKPVHPSDLLAKLRDLTDRSEKEVSDS